MRCSFSFGQIEELLAKAHRIAPERRTAFHGRLKHLQRGGFPTGESPGKGKAIRYTVEHLYKMVIVLELIQAGMPPKLSADIVTSSWSGLLATVYENLAGSSRNEVGGDELATDWCWLFRPEALRELTDKGSSEYDYTAFMEAVEFSRVNELAHSATNPFGMVGRSWRMLVVNGGPLVRGIAFLIEVNFQWVNSADMLLDLKEIISRKQDESEKVIADIRETLEGYKPKRRSLEDLYGQEQVAAARHLISEHHDLISTLCGRTDALVSLNANDLRFLQTLGVLTIEIEGAQWTYLGELLKEILLREEGLD